MTPTPGTPLTPETLGQVVRRSRGAVTGAAAAKDAGVSGSFWSDVEKDRRVPSRTVLARMCGAVVGNWNEWLVAWARERLDDYWCRVCREFIHKTTKRNGETVWRHSRHHVKAWSEHDARLVLEQKDALAAERMQEALG